jgi:hypothetical protein
MPYYWQGTPRHVSLWQIDPIKWGDKPMHRSRAIFRAALAAALATFITASVPPAMAAVLPPQQALPADTIQQFLANPSALLSQYPDGGAQMITQVRNLAASDPQTLNALIALLASANPDQAAAIGTALGQVALMAVNTDTAYATDIQTGVTGAQNSPALVAYSAVVGGDIKLAAATGGAGGGGGAEQGTGQNTTGGVSFGGGTLNLHPFATNTADSFTTLFFTPVTPGTPSVSLSTP